MYEIYANNTLIFSDTTPLESYKILNPRLTLEDSAAGSLEFTLPPGNVGYNLITCLTTECVVKKDNDEVWRGRVISESTDFWKNKRYMCEGELAYLVDTIQPPAKYSANSTTIYSFLNSLLTNHNSQVNGATNPYDKTFYIGSVTVEDGDQQVDDDAINRFTNYETTLECINDKLVSRLGGHLRIRHVNGRRYLDYLADAHVGSCEQEIRFGSNLLDYVADKSAIDWTTVVVPKGARLNREENTQPVAGLEEYLTGKYSNINNSWHASGSIYVKNPDVINTYGYVCATLDFNSVGEDIDLSADDANTKLQNSANTLVNKAQRYLQELQTNRFNKVTLTISAVDLHYLNPSIESFVLMEKVRCISDPHSMNADFPVTKIDIDLLNPSNTVYQLGSDIHSTLTSASNKADSDLNNYISETYVPVESAVLNGAKKNAVQLIEGSAKGGFASWIYDLKADSTDYGNINAVIDQKAVDPDPSDQDPWPKNPIGIRIADQATDKASNNRWLWTNGGLGHYTKDSNTHRWKPVNIGITMDGRIVADMITTGCIKLTGVSNKNEGSWSPDGLKQTFLKVYSSTTPSDNTVIGRWGSDGIWIGKGSLTIGSMKELPALPTYNNDTKISINPNSLGLYEKNNDGTYYKTSRTSVPSGVKFYAYNSQINENGSSVFHDALFTGTVVGATIVGSKIISQNNSDNNGCYMQAVNGDVEIYDTKNHYLACISDDNHDRYVTLGSRQWACQNGPYYGPYDTDDIFDLFEWWCNGGGQSHQNSIIRAAEDY